MLHKTILLFLYIILFWCCVTTAEIRINTKNKSIYIKFYGVLYITLDTYLNWKYPSITPIEIKPFMDIKILKK